MPKILRCLGLLLQAISLITLTLLIPTLLSLNEPGLAPPVAAFHESEFMNGKEPAGPQPAIPSAAAAPGTFQDFDLPGVGTPYTEVIYAESLREPELFDGGPTGQGKLMRLAFAEPPTPTHNGIAFDLTNPSTFTQIVADFDFRITLGNTRADGFGFALLNTSNYSITGTITPTDVAEEPNFMNSLGVGFDIYQSTVATHTEINNNHISIHFDENRVEEFNVSPTLDLGGGQWIHARIIMKPSIIHPKVTVILTPCGEPAKKIVHEVEVPGFTPYESRVYFAARSGGESADHDIDNIQVRYLNLSQSVLAFSNGCYSVVESKGEIRLTVTRVGSATGTVTMIYTTTNITAINGSDYNSTTGTVTFNSGKMTETIIIPITDDDDYEGEEDFLVSLSNLTGSADAIGGPAVAKVTILDDEQGVWSEVITLPVVPIHMHLLPTGEVLFWDRHDTSEGWDGMPYLWNPITKMTSAVEMPGYDLFCSGHSFMADGSLLVTGGHISNNEGENKASIYNPITKTWTSLPNMNAGRWYPSNVTLANGDVLVMAGTITTNVVNLLPQVWEVTTNTWRDLTDAQHGGMPATYPWLYLAPNGKVFNAGPQQMARYLDISGTGNWTDVDANSIAYRDYGSSVMYDEGKVMIVGGNPNTTTLPTTSTQVIDLNDESDPEWESVGSMHFGRRQHNATLLPDGTVLVTGGSSAPEFDNPQGAVLQAEIWDPETEEWTLMAAQKRYRGYHSTALLLPDGRVLVGGGGHPDPPGGPQLNFEIYSPPYLFKGISPTITAAPQHVPYGHVFFVKTPDAAKIKHVNWIRLSSVTHAFNQNQRINHLAFSQTVGGLNVTAPNNPNLAPPGHYMLFILNDKGAPSKAHMIRLGDKAPVANDDASTMLEDNPINLTVLANDLDPDNDALTITAVSESMSGTTKISNTIIVYTPTANINGIDSFTYTVSDGTLTDIAKVTITITPANDPPTMTNIIDQTICDGTLTKRITFTVEDIDDNSVSPTGHSSNQGIVPNSQIGFSGGGLNWTTIITRTANKVGTTTITITATDPKDAKDDDTFVLTVGCNLVHLPLIIKP